MIPACRRQAVLLLMVVRFAVTPAAAQNVEWSTKIVCGSRPPTARPLAPGRYYTAINIYNGVAPSLRVRVVVHNAHPSGISATQFSAYLLHTTARPCEYDCSQLAVQIHSNDRFHS